MGVRCYLQAFRPEFEAQLAREAEAGWRGGLPDEWNPFSASLDRTYDLLLFALTPGYQGKPREPGPFRVHQPDHPGVWAIRGRHRLPHEDGTAYYNNAEDVRDIVVWLDAVPLESYRRAVVAALIMQNHDRMSPVGAWAHYEHRYESHYGGDRLWHTMQAFYRRAEREGLLVLSTIS